MVVLREEQFTARNIRRTNQARVALEQAARQQRAQSGPVSRRVDSHQPMYGGSRAGHSGSGAVDAWTLALLAVLAVGLLVVRRRTAGRVA
jgi:Ca-activated chloride channel family protein